MIHAIVLAAVASLPQCGNPIGLSHTLVENVNGTPFRTVTSVSQIVEAESSKPVGWLYVDNRGVEYVSINDDADQRTSKWYGGGPKLFRFLKTPLPDYLQAIACEAT